MDLHSIEHKDATNLGELDSHNGHDFDDAHSLSQDDDQAEKQTSSDKQPQSKKELLHDKSLLFWMRFFFCENVSFLF